MTDKGGGTASDDHKPLDDKIDIIATEPFIEPIPIWKSEAKDGDKII